MDIRFYDSTNKRKKRDDITDDFESQMSAPSSVFAYHLAMNKKAGNINQINIFCKADANDYFFENEVIDGFWDIIVPYNPNELLTIDSVAEKRIEIKKLFSEIFTKIFTYKNWDLSLMRRALKRVEKVNFRNVFLLKGTPKKSPNRDYLAIVQCIEDITAFKMNCLIYDRKGNLRAEEVLIETRPSPFVYARFIGQPEWISDNEFSVRSKTSQWKATVSV